MGQGKFHYYDSSGYREWCCPTHGVHTMPVKRGSESRSEAAFRNQQWWGKWTVFEDVLPLPPAPSILQPDAPSLAAFRAGNWNNPWSKIRLLMLDILSSAIAAEAMQPLYLGCEAFREAAERRSGESRRRQVNRDGYPTRRNCSSIGGRRSEKVGRRTGNFDRRGK
jgi:hypothetical protein